MEKITKKFSDGTFYCEDIEDVGIKGVNAPTFVGKAINKLAEYEDLEEQGLILRLPCKVGDTVYSVVKDGLQIFELKFSLDFYVRRMSDFGKTVFLTKEEAEQALKQMGE